MRVVIVGAGVVGTNTAALLSREEHDVVLIDKNEEALAAVADQLDVMTITGGGTNPETLRQAGTANADLFIAATNVDEVNIVACFMARQMGAGRTVARVREADVRSPLIVSAGRDRTRVVRTKTMGVDFTITPEEVAAAEIVRVLRRTFALNVEEFGEGRVEMAELRMRAPLADGRPLREITFPRPCVVAAIIRNGEAIIPHGDDTIRADDRVYFVAARDSIGAIVAFFGSEEATIRRATILGGGRIGMHTARLLQKAGVRVSIIEKSLERSRELAARLDGVLVIHGEGSDSAFLREEGVGETDGFIAATGRDELNILVGLLAKRVGAKRAVIVVNKPEYGALVQELGMDASVNPLATTANAILRFVRRGQVVSFARLEGDAEALELVVSDDYRHAGTPLGELKLPKEMILGAIIRGERAIIPNGDTSIQPDDRVVVICTREAIPDVERHFGYR
jgi:trk system potassium uptake protein TrkA